MSCQFILAFNLHFLTTICSKIKQCDFYFIHFVILFFEILPYNCIFACLILGLYIRKMLAYVLEGLYAVYLDVGLLMYTTSVHIRVVSLRDISSCVCIFTCKQVCI